LEIRRCHGAIKPSTAWRLCVQIPIRRGEQRSAGDDTDDHARFIEAGRLHRQGAVRIASIYLPNGNPPQGDKYNYKIGWMSGCRALCAATRLALEEPVIMAATIPSHPTAADARNPQAWSTDALSYRARATNYARWSNLGFHRTRAGDKRRSRLYTFWDYQAGAWQKNNGIRIDHVMLSPAARRPLTDVGNMTATSEPGKSRPITVPVWVESGD